MRLFSLKNLLLLLLVSSLKNNGWGNIASSQCFLVCVCVCVVLCVCVCVCVCVCPLTKQL